MADVEDLTLAMQKGVTFFRADPFRQHILDGNCLLFANETDSAEFLRWQTYALIGHALNTQATTEVEVDEQLQNDVFEIAGRMAMTGPDNPDFLSWLETNRMLHSATNLTKGLENLLGEQDD